MQAALFLSALTGGLTRWLPGLRWLAIVWIVVFWQLGYPSLMDPDEAHYAQLTREMLQSGNWLVPLLDGRPYIDKPVLFHWLQGASMLLLGESEFAARLPSALASLALFGLTRRVGLALFGAAVGEWGAIMFATIPATFALSSIGLLDMLFTAFLFGAAGCLLIAVRERRRAIEWAGYGLLTLAVMTKGPVALVIVGLFCTIAWVAGGDLRAWVRGLHWKTGLLLAAIAASPWFIWMYVHFGQAFVEGYVLAGNVYYFTQPGTFSGRAVSHLFYARAFAGGFFPWSAIAAARGVDLALRHRTRLAVPVEEKLLWLWAIVIVGFFSAARFKLDPYIFPAAPALCLIAAKAWQDAALGDRIPSRAVRFCVLGLGAILVLAGSFTSVYLFELNLELPAHAIALPIVLAAGGIAILASLAAVDWRLPVTPIVPVMTLLALYAVVVTVGYPTFERTRPTALIARTLRQMTPADAPAGIYNLENWRASLRYYSERPLARLSTPDDVVAFMGQPRPIYVFMIRRDFHGLRQSGVALHEVFRCRAVVGTTRTGSGLRRQKWDDLILATNAPRRRARAWMP
jgi:4-amino-4-deoxy-L-arabinose transferase-like glycosyltransferase